MKVFPLTATPAQLPREKRTRCRPSCCKTPHFCAKNRACECHREEER